MTTKTQIFLNIVLVLCFAFTIYVSVQTNKQINDMRQMFQLIELRDQMYNETRMQVLENLSEAIKNAEKKIKLEQDRLNTL